MTRFITPGDIRRQTEATLRHRGVIVDDAVFRGTETHIVGGGHCSTLDADAETPAAIRVTGAFAVVYNRETNVASVSVPSMSELAYEFEGVES